MNNELDEARELARLLLRDPRDAGPPQLLQGVIAGLDQWSPYTQPKGTVTVYISGGADFPVGNVKVFDHYTPVVGDTVWLVKNGPDLMVLGRLTPSQPTLEAVHVVGAVGEPAFQNSWGNYGGGFDGAGFWKDSYGVVHLHGLVAGGSVTSAMFTLPVGYRPQRVMRFPSLANGIKVSVQVFTDGVVRMTATGTTSNAWCSLSGIEFRAEDAWPSGIGDWLADNDVPGNVYSDTNTDDPPQWSGLWRRPDGIWYYRGYIAAAAAAGAVVRNAPSESAPAYNWLAAALGFTSASGGHVHERLDYDRKTGRYIVLQSPTATHLSLDNMIFPEAALYGQFENLTSLLTNSWQAYKDTVSAKSDWGPPAIYKDPYGMCYMTGLLRNGSTTTSSVILTLPEEYWPEARHIYTIRNGAGSGRITVQENGAVLIGAGGDGANNTYMALDGIRFRASA